jgi:HD-GYP domain-containing protein (c-di-GMP phosphodiesterase class II)
VNLWEGRAVPASAATSAEPVVFGDETYYPITIKALRLDSVPTFDLYLRPSSEQPFILYCQRNSPFNAEAQKRLASYRRDRLYIRGDQRKDFHAYIAENLPDLLGDKRLSPREKSTILYDSAQAVVEQVLQDPCDRKAVRRGKNVARETVEFMNADDFKLEHLLRTISADHYLYTHSVNVVAYSVALAMRSGIHDRATLREIANGALLHDVGKSTLPKDLLDRKGPLTDHEWQRVKDTTRVGYQMMVDADCLGEIALDIILHHRERIDGSGYPDGLAGGTISRYVRIVAIADIFDALTCDRHHQKKRTSFEALETMGRTMKGQIDPELFRTFVSMMGNP